MHNGVMKLCGRLMADQLEQGGREWQLAGVSAARVRYLDQGDAQSGLAPGQQSLSGNGHQCLQS